MPPATTPPSTRSLLALVTAIVGLLTSVAGLLSAIAALRKPPEEPAAKASYEVLQRAYLDQASLTEENSKDLARLRKAFEDYLKAKEGPSAVALGGTGREPLRVAVRPTPALPAATPATSTTPIEVPSAREVRVLRPLPAFSEIMKKPACNCAPGDPQCSCP